MSAEPTPVETGSPELDLCIDALCDRFSIAAKLGERPSIEAFLEQAGPAAKCPELLRELVRLDIEYRRRAGEEPALEEYRTRFPQLPSQWLEHPLTPPTEPYVSQADRNGARMPAIPAGYEFLEVLGHGAQSIVYKVRERTGLRRIVALKMMRAPGPTEQWQVERFRFEAETVARLDHPNVVTVHAFGEHEGQPFFVMKYVEGGSLARHMGALRRSPRDAARLMARVARAVHYAHQRGVIHRDLKPHNILVDASGEPHVADFGLAKSADGTFGFTLSGEVVGTPSYMAPEQARGERGLTTAVDVYGLGAILYEALAGRPPFKGPTVVETLRQVTEEPPVPPRQLDRSADKDLEAVCLKCLQKDPKHRYPSAAAVAEDLEGYLDGKPVLKRQPRLWEGLIDALRRQGPVPPVDNWALYSLRSSLVVLAGHLSIFALVLANAATPWLWLTLVLYWWVIGGRRWRMARSFRSLAPIERNFLAVWVGHLLATIAAFVATGPITASAPIREVLNWYPVLAALTGIPAFVMGSTYWGLGYLFGLGYFVLAAALRAWPEAGPLAFGLFHAATLITFGYLYSRSVREERRSGELLIP
jgi:eukaryotic-like serine/threonine-protein kinase